MSSRRWWLYGTALVGLGLALLQGASEKELEVVPSVQRRPSSAAPMAATSILQAQASIDPIQPRAMRHARDADHPDIFTAPPPAPLAAASGAAITEGAPPLPFTYVGKRRDVDKWQVFLAGDKQTYVLSAGDTFDDAYRVVKIDPPLILIEYTPLHEVQTLEIE
jgi:hypothetical protein